MNITPCSECFARRWFRGVSNSSMETTPPRRDKHTGKSSAPCHQSPNSTPRHDIRRQVPKTEVDNAGGKESQG